MRLLFALCLLACSSPPETILPGPSTTPRPTATTPEPSAGAPAGGSPQAVAGMPAIESAGTGGATTAPLGGMGGQPPIVVTAGTPSGGSPGGGEVSAAGNVSSGGEPSTAPSEPHCYKPAECVGPGHSTVSRPTSELPPHPRSNCLYYESTCYPVGLYSDPSEVPAQCWTVDAPICF